MTSRPTALVTGSTGGMGIAIVRELARTHRVLAVGRDAARLDALAAETGAEPIVVDLLDVGHLPDAVPVLDELDLVVHAAAVGEHISVADATAGDWQRQLTTNVVAPSVLTRTLLPAIRRAEGTVVFIGSGAGTRPVPGSAVYTASKHALRAVADVLRIDEDPHRVRVVTIAPGQTDTPMLREGVEASGGAYTPERYIRPESIADAVRFVADASPDVHLTDLQVRPRQELARL